MQGACFITTAWNAGNTIFFAEMEAKRRAVDRFAQKREGASVDKEPISLKYETLVTELEEMRDRHIVWIGTVIAPEVDSIPAEAAEALESIDKSIALCPEC